MLKPVELPFGKTIYQTDIGHSITTDTAFLVETIQTQVTKKNLNALELGSGNGIISIMLSHCFLNWNITGIEIQPHLVELSIQNAKQVNSSINFIEADLRSYRSDNRYDLIFSNPPYFPREEGRISPKKERAISRHEITCDMFSVLKCVKRNLSLNGKAFILYPVGREQQLGKNAKKVDLKVKKKFVLELEKNEDRVIMELVHA